MSEKDKANVLAIMFFLCGFTLSAALLPFEFGIVGAMGLLFFGFFFSWQSSRED